jgi:hypothetical protein
VHPPRAKEWLGDILYLQSEPELPSGLGIAMSHLLAAPRLSCATVVEAVRKEPLEPFPLGSGNGYHGDGFDNWVYERADNAGHPVDLGETIYTVAHSILAEEPEIVDFVRDSDGVLRGMMAQGSSTRGTVIRASLYTDRRMKWPRINRRRMKWRRVTWRRAWGDELCVAGEKMMDALQNLADTADNFGFDNWHGDRLTAIFPEGMPEGSKWAVSSPGDWTRMETHLKSLRRL